MNSVEFKNVTKTFKIWHERPDSIKTILADALRLRFNKGEREARTVLKNISFDIRKNDFVGIMGRNGAGKSTILKLISGIYHPSKGQVITNGRVAPLLELGAGFATELSGYENIFLNASILGFGRAQATRYLDSIIEFSELGEAISRPVRKYSSGMLVRLGFSIAVHLEADILLFDEILAVGDVGFQDKCMRKIRELHQSGSSIVLVTHHPGQIEQFCDRCIVVDHSGILFDGGAKEGANCYRSLFPETSQAVPVYSATKKS